MDTSYRRDLLGQSMETYETWKGVFMAHNMETCWDMAWSLYGVVGHSMVTLWVIT